MAQRGEVIENPVSGERMVFVRTGAETAGKLLEIDLFVEPDGAVGAPHVHPRQDERFVVKRGQMTLIVNGRERVLRAGDEAVVVAGSEHEWWNSGDTELNATLEFRPAGRFDAFISSYFGLAKAGQTDGRGRAGLLQSAVMLHEYRDTVQLTELHPLVRRYVLPVANFVGRMFGLRPEYPYPVRERRPARAESKDWRPLVTAGEDVGVLVGR